MGIRLKRRGRRAPMIREFLRIDREFVCANVRQTLQNKYKDILWTMTK
jgi:hypothetical protein